ncbi:hypothetical protein JRQ81_002488 [Phrynocephalus forsythii]|uniref:Uncharacterized protein n=1 Tax=Phrynocephalus forsythii TaxID=171643 RepID=A0A9Q0XIR1_9SAUR|nr:hypothetical protein JRQ81_002488 [Phrynocephalus forsythii]
MKPASRSRFGRKRFQIVYINSFGRHRSGNVIHYSGGNSGHHLRPQEKVAPTDALSSCLTAEALLPVSDRRGPGGPAAPSPSSKGPRSPHLLPATSTMQVQGTCERGPLGKVGQAKESKARKLPKGKKAGTELLPSLNQECDRRRGDLNFPASASQKQIGDHQETQADPFEFPAPMENASNAIKQQNKKSAVWLGVCKVISKMVEENSHFRDRLMSCSQLSCEGKGMSEDVETGASYIGTDEAIFGWV